MPTITRRGNFPFVVEPASGRLVFCFHHAGGNASAYRDWVGANPRVYAVPVELPGKATRIRERWIGDFSLLTQQLAAEVSQFAGEEEIVLYGHSMGAALAYQTAACLQESHRRDVHAVIVAARQAPGETIDGEYHSSMGLEALRKELESVGGTPAEILANDDIMALLLDGIRRDYALHEDFDHTSTILSCPILAFAGAEDPTLAPQRLDRWSQFTSSRFELEVVEGGHFFWMDAPGGFLDRLADGIDRVTRA
ncbi:MAG: alpha/beta fold hydrolase [Propionibacteriaceae bacterium]|nr:alpha/beta fold hydrolase [Propionibacteriaceae bacterium]